MAKIKLADGRWVSVSSNLNVQPVSFSLRGEDAINFLVAVADWRHSQGQSMFWTNRESSNIFRSFVLSQIKKGV